MQSGRIVSKEDSGSKRAVLPVMTTTAKKSKVVPLLK
jgi:hypothetical protein